MVRPRRKTPLIVVVCEISNVLHGGLAGLGTLGAWMQVVLRGLGVVLVGLGRGGSVFGSGSRPLVFCLGCWVVGFSAVGRPARWWWVSFGFQIVRFPATSRLILRWWVCGAGVRLLSFCFGCWIVGLASVGRPAL